MTLSILQTNDMHGTLDAQRLAQLEALRGGCDLYFDTGDAIKTGNLGIPLKEDPVWAMFKQLRCDASVLGNRETHPLPSAFEAKIAGASHPILVANMRRKDGSRPFPGHLILPIKGVRVGLIGVMVPMATERMKTQMVWDYLWDAPIPTALAQAEELRPQVDVLFALTHIGHRTDQQLAEKGGFDVIFGGHSHTVLYAPQKVEKTWIVQGGSHNRYAGVYEWNMEGELRGSLVDLQASRGGR